jgi:hypothetical protein
MGQSIEIGHFEIGARGLWNVFTKVGAQFPGSIPSANLIGRKTASVDKADIQFLVAFENSTKNHAPDSKSRVERISDQVPQEVARPLWGFTRSRVNQNKQTPSAQFSPDGLKGQVIQIESRDICTQFNPNDGRLVLPPTQFDNSGRRILQRQCEERTVAGVIGASKSNRFLVDDLGLDYPSLNRERVSKLRRRRREQLQVHTLSGHIDSPGVRISHSGWQRPAFSSGRINQEPIAIALCKHRGKRRQLPSYSINRFGGDEMSVGIDREHYVLGEKLGRCG